MDNESFKQSIIDNEHLRLLSIAHYISGGLTLAFCLIFFVQFFFMFTIFDSIATMKANTTNPVPEEVIPHFFTFFKYFWGFLVFIFSSFGILEIISGRFLSQRRNKTFSIIVSIPNLLFVPFGTILGISTILVLNRVTVISLYKKNNDEDITPNNAM